MTATSVKFVALLHAHNGMEFLVSSIPSHCFVSRKFKLSTDVDISRFIVAQDVNSTIYFPYFGLQTFIRTVYSISRIFTEINVTACVIV